MSSRCVACRSAEHPKLRLSRGPDGESELDVQCRGGRTSPLAARLESASRPMTARLGRPKNGSQKNHYGGGVPAFFFSAVPLPGGGAGRGPSDTLKKERLSLKTRPGSGGPTLKLKGVTKVGIYIHPVTLYTP